MIYPEFVVVNGAIRVEDQLLCCQRSGFLQFGGQKEANGAQQLQTALGYGTDTQETIHVVDGQPVNVRLALLFFANLCGEIKKRF